MALAATRRVRDAARVAAVRVVAGHADPADGVLLTGSPRSGTTWVGQVLGSAVAANTLFEPLHPEQVPEASAAGFRWRTWRDPSDPWPSGLEHVTAALRGRPASAWTYRDAVARPTRHWVVKCVRANRLLPWLAVHAPTDALVLVVRDPVDTVASQLRAGWRPRTGVRVDDELRALLPGMPASADLPDSLAGRLASLWAVDNVVPLTWPGERGWTTVRHRDLVDGGVGYAEDLLRACGLTPSRDLEARLRAPSSTTGLTVDGGSRRDGLTPGDVADVVSAVRAFGLDVDDDGRLPHGPSW